jgi:hypothetical protein
MTRQSFASQNFNLSHVGYLRPFSDKKSGITHRVVAAQISDSDGIPLEDAIFLELVKPNATIPPFIPELTSITNNSVSTVELFPEVAGAFIQFMRRHSNKYSNGHDDVHIEHIVLEMPHGKVFDIPFLMQQLSFNRMVEICLQDKRFGFGFGHHCILPKRASRQTKLLVFQ